MSRPDPRFQPFFRLADPGRARLAAACAVVLAIAACTDDAVTGPGTGVTSTQVASVSPQPGSAQANPATPPPAAVPSPVRQAPVEVATPVPPGVATPAPAATASASGSVGASASPETSPSPGAGTSPSPTPSASPGAQSTGVATDLYISGPAYFLLSTAAAPTTVAQLLFTRNGHFKTKLETVNGLSVYRLVHADDDFYLLGFSKAGASVGTGVPDEADGINDAVLTLNWGGTATAAQALTLDADRNAGADTKLSFGENHGLLRINNADPRSGSGDPLTAYVGLVAFGSPENLEPLTGYPGVFRFNANAGHIYTGVSYQGTNRPVGNPNLIKPTYLEQ